MGVFYYKCTTNLNMIFSYWNERMRWRNITRYHWLYLLSQILYMKASECPYCWDNINAYRCCRGWYGIEQMVVHVSVSCSSWSAAVILHPDTLYNQAHLLCLDNAASLQMFYNHISSWNVLIWARRYWNMVFVIDKLKYYKFVGEI